MSGRCLDCVSERCLEDAWKESGKFLEGVFNIAGKCPGGVWEEYINC